MDESRRLLAEMHDAIAQVLEDPFKYLGAVKPDGSDKVVLSDPL